MNEGTSYERYQRQLVLKGFGAAAQQKLAASKVLVVGAGGLGCPALQYLVAAGVGTVGVVDDDEISLSNLQRQTLYATAEVGSKKAIVAAQKLAALNPDVAVVVYPFRLTNEEAVNLFPAYDIIVDGTDNFASRYLINDAGALLQKPVVYGAVSQYQGQVAVFGVADAQGIKTNYRHLFPQPPLNGEVANCAEAGVLGVLPGIIGAMQAAEAIKLITGVGKPLANRLLTYDLLSNFFYEVVIVPNDSIVLPETKAHFLAMDYADACAAQPAGVEEIDADAFHALRGQPSSVVIDVREKGEAPLLKNLAHKQLPMSVFEKEMSGIKEQTVLLICQHGVRSLHAGELLKERFGTGKKIYSLKGGIAKWNAVL